MSNTDKIRPRMDRDELRMLSQGLRVFIHQLQSDCQADLYSENTPEPPEVSSQIQRLEGMADSLDGTENVDFTWAGAVACIDSKKPFDFIMSPDDWRTAAAALTYLAGRVYDADDRPHAKELTALAEKVGVVGRAAKDWFGWVRPETQEQVRG